MEGKENKVSEKKAVKSEYTRKVNYFCCPACKRILIKNLRSISRGNRE